jgi:hypothetical protein
MLLTNECMSDGTKSFSDHVSYHAMSASGSVKTCPRERVQVQSLLPREGSLDHYVAACLDCESHVMLPKWKL